ncbi:MAG: SbcC/MukB-like Walker B domain-containing protein, partial [Marmoricola sp.]
RRAEDRARKKYETAGVALTALDEVIAAGRARAEALEQRAGGVSLVAWEQQVADLRARRDDLAARAGAIEPLQSQISAIDTRAEHLAMGISAQVQLEAQARAQLESAIRRREDAEAEVADALGDHLDAQEYLAQARLRADRVASAARAHRRSREADSEAAQCRAALDLQARSLGFAAGDDAEQALLNPERAEAIRRCEHERSQRRLGARAVLEDPLVLASLPLPRPDLEQLAREATQADHAFAAAQASLHLATTRQSRSRAVREELDAAVARYQPIETKAEQVQALSGLLEGTGADNRLRMRLSAFVLAERLRQVIDAANARLQVISEGRYVLSYQEERGAGEARGGLSLSILDEWTGVRRDPSTLSGGETFVVSLCLALGLADTVADEAGGLRIDTLFIDEGFGSLDAQTLDSVIDILGQLSQGGRVTGVVSHVSELRERMPAVLEVVPSKSGSTVRRAAL